MGWVCSHRSSPGRCLTAGGSRQCRRGRHRLRAAEAKAAVAKNPEVAAGRQMHYAAGDSLATAKRAVQARVPPVVPWSKDVDIKSMYAISDRSPKVAKVLVTAAFRQFGSIDRMRLSVFGGISKEDRLDNLLGQAQGKGKALVVYMFFEPGLTELLEEKCASRGIPCTNLLASTFSILERKLNMKRLDSPDHQAPYTPGEANKASVEGLVATSDDISDLLGGGSLDNPKKRTIFAVSDSNGVSATQIVKLVMKSFSGCPVETVTTWPRVRRLEKVDYVAREAFARDAVVIFSFASPGMSRFMRQQCERLKVLYADVFQPLVLAMEAYLDHPPVGVTGGYAGLDTGRLNIDEVEVTEEPL